MRMRDEDEMRGKEGTTWAEEERERERERSSRDGRCAASGQECLDCSVKSSGGRWRRSGDDGWIDSVRERERSRSQ